MDPTAIGVALVAVVVVVDKVISMLKSRGIDLNKLSRQIEDLHQWHNVNDDEGVKIWYFRRSFEDAIQKLADNIELECKLLDRIDRRLERVEEKVDRAAGGSQIH
jgi:hypothetical protein